MTSASISRVRLITTYSQFDLAMSDSNTVVVILFTVPGCPHCTKFLPEYNSLSIERATNKVSKFRGTRNANTMRGTCRSLRMTGQIRNRIRGRQGLSRI